MLYKKNRTKYYIIPCSHSFSHAFP